MAPRLVVYFPLADPRVPSRLVDVYARASVDVIECGWPAKNPYLDGPDVRSSMARSGDPAPALQALAERVARMPNRPVLLVMTYAEADPPAVFAGADALLAVGDPDGGPRRALEAQARAQGLNVAAFLPLPLRDADIFAARSASPYAMLQAAPGVTGPRDSLDPGNAVRIRELRAKGVTAPIVLGFGISNGGQARRAAELGADGIVVGSAALRAALEGEGALAALLEDLRRGLDG